MISALRALKILNEKDEEKRDKMIDGLTEEDAKYMLKMGLKHIHKNKDFKVV